MSAIPHLKLAGTERTPDAHPGLPGTSDGSWLWYEEAAQRARISDGQVRRNCPAWATQGLARKQRRDNGQLAWQVHETADPRFARVKDVDTLSAQADLTALTDTQRQEVLRRERICKGWDEAIAGGVALGMSKEDATSRYLDQLQAAGDKASRSKLYRWHSAWRERARAGLFDKRWQNPGCTSGACEDTAATTYRDLLLGYYLTGQRRSKKLSHHLAAEHMKQRGLIPPAYATAKRIIAGLDPATVTRMREGKAAHTDKHHGYIERDYSSIDSNDWWTSDHHRLDVICTHEGKNLRPWLHAWQDIRSRKIVGWTLVATDPNADLILQTVSDAIGINGKPSNAYVDNGKDYDSRTLQGVTKKQRQGGQKPGELSGEEIARLGGAFGIMDINVVHCWPYHGQSKPIERFFRTVKERFSVLWDTYTGGTTAEKPEDLAKHVKAGHAPTLDELRTAFGEWLEGDYHHKIHLGDSMHGKTPDQVYRECLHRKTIVPVEIRRFACMPRFDAMVRQNGVYFKECSWGRGNPELAKRIKQKVQIAMDLSDLSYVLVIDTDGKLICRAEANNREQWGADAQQLREAVSAIKKAEKTQREAVRQRPRATLDAPAMMAAIAADKAEQARQQNPGCTSGAPSIAIERTHLADQATALRDAFSKPHQMAVGAESIDPQQINDTFAGRSREAMNPGCTSGTGDAFMHLSGAFARQREDRDE